MPEHHVQRGGTRRIIMKFRILHWLGLVLILQTGLVHLYLMPETFAESTYEGMLFLANAIGAVAAAYGIYRGKVWGWNLGLLIAAGSIVAYIISRTVGMPGMAIEEWGTPLGNGALVVESAFLIVCRLMNPWVNITNSNTSAALVLPALEFPVANRTLIPAVSVITLSLALLFTLQWNAHRPGAILISQQELEDKYGLRVSLLGATAMNSIIDFRLKIVDANKASTILSANHHDALGLIVDGAGGDIITAARMSRHGSMLKDGGLYITFFPNPRDEIRSGTPVSVVFGELRLEPIVAQ
jgi:hypothetical protein